MTHEEVAYEQGKDAMRETVKDAVEEIKGELNQLAMMGALPLWNSLIARLDDLVERIEPKN